MKKVLVHGAYNGDNFGDTLLLVLMVNELNKKNVDIVLSNTCELTYKRCKGFSNVRLHKGIFDIMSCDCIIFGGGGYFGEQPNGKRIWYLNFIKNHLLIGYFFVLLRKPVAFIGVEFGELSNFFIRWLSCNLLNYAKIIGARNNGSSRWVKDNTHSKDEATIVVCNLFEIIQRDPLIILHNCMGFLYRYILETFSSKALTHELINLSLWSLFLSNIKDNFMPHSAKLISFKH